jgi:hypothetical protein
MPGPFTITTTTNTLHLDTKGQAQAVFTVSNDSQRALRGRGRIAPQDPAQDAWFTVDGAAVRDFPVAGTQQYTVLVAVPPATPPATYSFRFDEVGEFNPDEEFTLGPTVSFTVLPPPPPQPAPKIPMWAWIAAAVVALLIVVGIIAFLLWPRSTGFAGTWVLNFGTMQLTDNGDRVSGTFQDGLDGTNGTLMGNVTNGAFNGTWTGNGSGILTMTLGAGGNTITGRRNSLNQWCGARANTPFPAGCNYAGDWTTSDGIFQFPTQIARTGITVTGVFTYNPTATGTLTGTVSYNGTGTTQLDGTYTVGTFTSQFRWYLLSYNALQFQGSYGPGSGPWCGWRQGGSAPSPCLRSTASSSIAPPNFLGPGAAVATPTP